MAITKNPNDVILLVNENGRVKRIVLTTNVQVGTIGSPAELQLTGKLILNSRTVDVNAGGTVVINDTDNVVNVNIKNGSGNVSVLLPNLPKKGTVYYIKDAAGKCKNNNIIIKGNGLIDGSSTQNLKVNYGSILLAWSGDNWSVLNVTTEVSSSTGITGVTAGTGLIGGGTSGNVTLSINNSIVATVSGTTFTGVTKHNAGLSGSLTQLTDGTSYLVAGNNVTITTGSNGAVTIGASLAGGAVDGSGTTGKLAKFTASTTVGDSLLSESSTTLTSAGTAFTFTNPQIWTLDANTSALDIVRSGGSTVMKLDSSNYNVGINVSPSDKLHIALNDSQTVDAFTATGSRIIRLQNTNSTNGNSVSIIGSDGSNQMNSYIRFINVDHSLASAITFGTSNSGGSNKGERVRINQVGNVGIGTTNPTQFLQVGEILAFPSWNASTTPASITLGTTFSNTAGAYPKLRLFDSPADGVVNGFGISSGQLDYIAAAGVGHVFYVAGSEKVRITSVGSVGIGTSNPAAFFEISGSLTGARNANLQIGVDLFGTISVNTSKASGHVWYHSDGTQRILLDSIGNIGIGSSVTLNNKLQVEGNIGLQNGGYLAFSTSTAGAGNFSLYGDTSSTVLNGPSSGFIGFKINNSEKVRLTSIGNVGIGLTTTTDKLAVNGSMSVTGSLLPGDDGIYDLGSTDKRWAWLYVGELDITGDIVASTLTSTALTPGSVVFADAGSTLWGDVSNLFWDYTNYRLGIGTSTVGSKLTVLGDTSTTMLVQSGSLGIAPNAGVAYNSGDMATFQHSNGNTSLLKIKGVRHTAGSNWTSASTRIQQVIDVTNQAYIEFNPAGSTYGFAIGTGTGPTEALRIDSSQRVGIGTTNPTQKLHIGSIVDIGSSPSTATPDSITLGSSYSSTPGVNHKLRLWEATVVGVPVYSGLGISAFAQDYSIPSGWNHVFYVGGAEKARITSAGSVGIGTSNPNAFFEVSGSLTGARNANLRIGIDLFGATSVNTSKASGHVWYHSDDTQRMLIDSTGNVGVGSSTTLNNKLQIEGNLGLQNGGRIAFSTSAAGTGNFSLYGDTSSTILNGPSAGVIGFRIGNTEYARITSAGNVGIGTTTTTDKLAVSGKVSITGSLFPGADSAHNIGDPLARWDYVYANNLVSYASFITPTIFTTDLFAANVYAYNVSETYLIDDVGGSTTWVKLGTYQAAQDGRHLYIKVVTSTGYNAIPAQQSEVYIHFKTSNGSSVDSNGFAGDATFYVANGSTGYNVKVKSNAAGTSADTYEVWLQQPAYNGKATYTVECPKAVSATIWTHAGTTGSDPGSASSTVCIAIERFLIQSNVGIGTTNPTQKLQIGSIVDIGSSPSTATPDSITLGSSYSNTSGFNPKLRLWESTVSGVPVYSGLGISAFAQDYSIPAGWNHVFYVGGAEKARITSVGSVGIGTNNPAALFEVSGSLTGTRNANLRIGIDLFGSTSVNTSKASGHVWYHSDDTQRMIIDSTGIVGIATAPPVTVTASKLVVGADITLAKANVSLLGNLYYDTTATAWKYTANGYGWGFREDNAGKLQMLRAGNNSGGAGATASVSLTDLLTFDLVNNRVGLGTGSPDVSLDVNGKVRLRDDVGIDAGKYMYFGREESFGGSDTGGSDYGYIVFNNDDNNYNYWGDSAENSSLVIGSQNDGANSVSDVVVLKGAAANIFDSPGLNNIFPGNNKVGIGTTNPTQFLQVGEILAFPSWNASTTPATITLGTTFSNTAGAYPKLRLFDSPNDGVVNGFGVSSGQLDYIAASGVNHVFYVGGAEKMRIDSSGNVGIGTTDPTSNAETVRIYKAGEQTIIGMYSTTHKASLALTGFSSTTPVTTGLSSLSNRGGVGTGTNHPLVLVTNDTEKVRIDTSGNVGIGTTNSAGIRLHVYSGATDEVARFEGTGNPYISIYDSNTRNAYLYSNASSVELVSENNKPLYMQAATEIRFRTNGTNDRVTIDSSGNIGLGTTQPNYYFDVRGTSQMQSIFPRLNNTYNLGFDFGIFGVAAYANVYAYAYPAPSDYRFKKNVEEITGSLERISKLRPVSYEYNELQENVENLGMRVGFIAHELQEQFPNLVAGEKDDVHENGRPKSQLIYQDDLIPYMVDAMKQLKLENDALKSELQSLKNQIGDIIHMINNK